MFRLFRRLIFILIVFVSGMLFERSHQMDLCEKSGGIWIRAGFCGEKEI